jgi:hypothetical protein
MSFETGTAVRITGLVSRAELNGTCGTIHSWDTKLGRWKVRVEGQQKLMALHQQNLAAVETSSGVDMLDIVSVKLPGKRARVAHVAERRADGTMRVEFESVPRESVWVDAEAATPLPAADEEAVPTEFLYAAVLARETGEAGKRKTFQTAEVRAACARADTLSSRHACHHGL